MDRKAALATAAGLVLVVAGAASALTSTWLTPPSEAAIASTTTGANVIVEYVDEFGNPVDPPGTISTPETIIVQRSAEPEEIVITLPSADVVYETGGAFTGTTGAFGDDHDDDHDDEDEHEDDHEDDDENEDEDEHEDEDDHDDD